MRPIEAFQDTFERAHRFLRFHDGLINTRQRGIRADWKNSFCDLMHWPKAQQIERVDSRDAVLILRNTAAIIADDFSSEALEDQLRAAITFGVSALDRYVHERIVKGFVTAFRSSTLLKQQREFMVPATLAIDIVNKVSAAARNNDDIRPANEIRNVVQKALHKRPFQSWSEIEYGFNLLGYTNISKEIKEKTNSTDVEISNLKEKLGKIVARRNQIVHEGDLQRHQRGGQVSVQPIMRKWVEESLSDIKTIVTKLDAI